MFLGWLWLSPCRLCQALPSAPPSLVGFLIRRPSAFFFFLAFSGSARSGLGVLVCVFAPSFFFCVPLFASWLSNFHLIFIVIPFSSFLHLHLHLICRDLKTPRGSEVCVEHLKRCNTSNLLNVGNMYFYTLG